MGSCQALMRIREGISEAPLRSLALLRSEVGFMGETVAHLSETISCNHLHNLNAMLARLHMKVGAVVINLNSQLCLLFEDLRGS